MHNNLYDDCFRNLLIMEEQKFEGKYKGKIREILSRKKFKIDDCLIAKDLAFPDIKFQSSRKIIGFTLRLNETGQPKNKESTKDSRKVLGNTMNNLSEKKNKHSVDSSKICKLESLSFVKGAKKSNTPNHKRNGGQDFSPVKLRLPSVSATTKNTSSNSSKYIKLHINAK